MLAGACKSGHGVGGFTINFIHSFIQRAESTHYKIFLAWLFPELFLSCELKTAGSELRLLTQLDLLHCFTTHPTKTNTKNEKVALRVRFFRYVGNCQVPRKPPSVHPKCEGGFFRRRGAHMPSSLVSSNRSGGGRPIGSDAVVAASQRRRSAARRNVREPAGSATAPPPPPLPPPTDGRQRPGRGGRRRTSRDPPSVSAGAVGSGTTTVRRTSSRT